MEEIAGYWDNTALAEITTLGEKTPTVNPQCLLAKGMICNFFVFMTNVINLLWRSYGKGNMAANFLHWQMLLRLHTGKVK